MRVVTRDLEVWFASRFVRLLKMPEKQPEPNDNESESTSDKEQRDGEALKEGTPVAQPLELKKEPQHPDPPDGAAGKQDGWKAPKPPNWPPLWHVIIEAFAAIAITCFTLGQVIVGHWQWSAMSDQNDTNGQQLTAMQQQTADMSKQVTAAQESAAASMASATAAQASVDLAREMSSKQLRAYIVLDANGTLECTATRFRATLVLKNVGQTPAYKVSSKFNQIFKTCDYSGPFDLTGVGTANGSGMTAGPGRSWGVTVDYAPQKGDIEALSANQCGAWVFGTITYKDEFGGERFTNVRLTQGEATTTAPIIQGNKLIQNAIIGYSLMFTDEGNDSN